MKNFKFLLATTAILSMGTVAVNSADLSYTDSAEISVVIELWKANEIAVVEDLINFGALIATGEHSDASVRLDPATGMRTITGSGVTAAIDEFLLAEIAVNIPTGYKATLTLPSDVELDDENFNDLDLLTFVPEYASTRGNSYNDNYNIQRYRIGGSIDLSESKFSGYYNGSFTVTAVVEPE